MPSLASATVLFLTLGLCRARVLLPIESREAACGSSNSVISSPSSSTLDLTVGQRSSTPTSAVIHIGRSDVTQYTSSATTVPADFAPGVKWQIAIQDPIDVRGGIQPIDTKVLDVDLFLASKDPTLIPALHDAGVTVLCYFNAGAIQYTDCDFPQWTSDGLFSGESVANYDQERYVDITSSTVVDLHKARVDLAHSIGCDGIDPDNIDTYQLDPDAGIGKQITEEDVVIFLGNLASYAHSKTTTRGHPLMIGQKNAVELTQSVHSFMDFALSENCVGSSRAGSNRGDQDEFCSTFQQYYTNNGKPVFDIEYPASLGTSSTQRRDASDIDASQAGCSSGTDQSEMESYCSMYEGNSTGISRILKLDDDEFGLNGCTQYCAESNSFLLPTYQSNSSNSCDFGPA